MDDSLIEESFTLQQLEHISESPDAVSKLFELLDNPMVPQKGKVQDKILELLERERRWQEMRTWGVQWKKIKWLGEFLLKIRKIFGENGISKPGLEEINQDFDRLVKKYGEHLESTKEEPSESQKASKNRGQVSKADSQSSKIRALSPQAPKATINILPVDLDLSSKNRIPLKTSSTKKQHQIPDRKQQTKEPQIKQNPPKPSSKPIIKETPPISPNPNPQEPKQAQEQEQQLFSYLTNERSHLTHLQLNQQKIREQEMRQKTLQSKKKEEEQIESEIQYRASIKKKIESSLKENAHAGKIEELVDKQPSVIAGAERVPDQDQVPVHYEKTEIEKIAYMYGFTSDQIVDNARDILDTYNKDQQLKADHQAQLIYKGVTFDEKVFMDVRRFFKPDRIKTLITPIIFPKNLSLQQTVEKFEEYMVGIAYEQKREMRQKVSDYFSRPLGYNWRQVQKMMAGRVVDKEAANAHQHDYSIVSYGSDDGGMFTGENDLNNNSILKRYGR